MVPNILGNTHGWLIVIFQKMGPLVICDTLLWKNDGPISSMIRRWKLVTFHSKLLNYQRVNQCESDSSFHDIAKEAKRWGENRKMQKNDSFLPQFMNVCGSQQDHQEKRPLKQLKFKKHLKQQNGGYRTNTTKRNQAFKPNQAVMNIGRSRPCHQPVTTAT